MNNTAITVLIVMSVLICSCAAPSTKPKYTIYRNAKQNLVMTNPELPQYTYEEDQLMAKQVTESLPKCIEHVVKLPSSISQIRFLGRYIVYQETKPKNTIVCFDYLAKHEIWRLENKSFSYVSDSMFLGNPDYIVVEANKDNHILVVLKTGKEIASFNT